MVLFQEIAGKSKDKPLINVCLNEIERLQAEVAHWKHNHDNQVQSRLEQVGRFHHNQFKDTWEQDTPERRIKGITHPLYRLKEK